MAETTLYNPASLKEEDLISSFVVRTKIFERIFKDIKGGSMRYPEKNYLIQGSRGMGKTTLLLRLKYEVERTDSLREWLIPIFFNEETYDVNSLSNLWEKLLKYLDDYFDTGGEYYDYTDKFVDQEDYERLCFNFLIEKLRTQGKKLIIFFDNFGEFFLDNLRDREKRRLREILIDCSDIRIVGASAIVIQDLHDYSQPFFEFFQMIPLYGLSKEETYNLIVKLQEDCPDNQRIDLEKHKAKIEALAVLTGGAIRTIMMLYQVLLDDPNGKAVEDLEKVLDKVTPLYKHRVEDLPVQQRRIVDVLAKKWDAVSAKEIAGEIRDDGKKMATKLISAQLSQLEKNNVVEKKATTTKNHFYQLKDRFFNIWYLMRNGDRRDRKRVAWLTNFLEVWYDDEDSFDNFLKNHISSLRSGKYLPSSALLMAEALAHSDKFDPNKLDVILEETSNMFRDNEKQYLPNIESEKIALAVRYSKEDNLENTIGALVSIKNTTTESLLLLAFLYVQVERLEDAELVLKQVEEVGNDLLFFLLEICAKMKNYKPLFEIIDRSKDLESGNVEKVLGDVCFHEGQFDAALAHYNKAVEEGQCKAFARLKVIYESKKDFNTVEEILLEGFEEGVFLRGEIYAFYGVLKNDYVALKAWLDTDEEKDGSYYLYSGVLDLKADSGDERIDIGYPIAKFEKAIALFVKERKVNENLLLVYMLTMTYYVYKSRDLSKAENLLATMDDLEGLTSLCPMSSMFVAFVKVWGGDYQDEVVSCAFARLENADNDKFSDLLLLLLARKQYHYLLTKFEENNKLKELFKPIYYALMTLMEKEYPNEIIKMGEELKVTVEEILQRVEQMKVEYQH